MVDLYIILFVRSCRSMIPKVLAEGTWILPHQELAVQIAHLDVGIVWYGFLSLVMEPVPFSLS